MSTVGLPRSEWKRWCAWLLVGLLSSCAGASKNGPAPKTAATGAEPLEPVDGETAPEPRSGLGPFDSPVVAMVASEDTIAISLAAASTVRLFDSRTGQPMGELPCPTSGVLGLRFSPDGKHLSAISQRQNEVYVWDVAARSPARPLGVPKKVWSALPLAGGARVAVAGEDGMVVIAAVDTGKLVRSIPMPDKSTVYGLGLSRSGRWLSGVVEGRSMIVVDLERNDPIRIADADMKMQLSATEFSPDELSVVARGSSFLPPKMVSVGAHPEGAEPAAATTGSSPSYAGCSVAMVATGLIGYAICAAIVSSSAPTADQPAARAAPPEDGVGSAKKASSGPADRNTTVDIAGLSGELMLWRLSDPQPVVVKAFGRTFEQMAWSKDSAKVALVASGIQDGEMVKRVLIYQSSQIGRSSALPPAVGTVVLGRAGTLLAGAIASDQATVFMERSQPARPAPAGAQPAPAKQRFTVERWSIPALQTAVGGNDHPAATVSASPPH